MSDHYSFMEEALNEASDALSRGEFPVGCVMVYDQQIIARGRRRQSGAQAGQPANEVDHAEILALRNLLNSAHQAPLDKVTVYATMEPCLMCYATLLISGIRTFVYSYEDVMGGGTALRLDQLPLLYRTMVVSITPHILREKSLFLFKQFFKTNTNPYLRDTTLAEYTLAQS